MTAPGVTWWISIIFISNTLPSKQTALNLIQSTMEAKRPNMESKSSFGRDAHSNSEFDSEALIYFTFKDS